MLTGGAWPVASHIIKILGREGSTHPNPSQPAPARAQKPGLKPKAQSGRARRHMPQLQWWPPLPSPVPTNLQWVAMTVVTFCTKESALAFRLSMLDMGSKIIPLTQRQGICNYIDLSLAGVKRPHLRMPLQTRQMHSVYATQTSVTCLHRPFFRCMVTFPPLPALASLQFVAFDFCESVTGLLPCYMCISG